MTPKLTEEQRQALRATGEKNPVRVIDPATNVAYVLVRADVYDEMRGLFEDFDPRETYPLVDQVMRQDDENDPSLESYQGASTSRSQP